MSFGCEIGVGRKDVGNVVSCVSVHGSPTGPLFVMSPEGGRNFLSGTHWVPEDHREVYGWLSWHDLVSSGQLEETSGSPVRPSKGPIRSCPTWSERGGELGREGSGVGRRTVVMECRTRVRVLNVYGFCTCTGRRSDSAVSEVRLTIFDRLLAQSAPLVWSKVVS